MERGDMICIHEPFTNLAETGVCHLGGIASHTEEQLMTGLWRLSNEAPVFFKDTTEFRYSRMLGDEGFLRIVTHTFLIRDPGESIPSHFAGEGNLKCEMIGYDHAYELYQAARRASGKKPTVVDSGDLIERPAQTIEAYCAAVGIPYIGEALTWSPGEQELWKATKRWHGAVSRSTGFERIESQYEETVSNNPMLRAFYAHHLPYYAALWKERLLLRQPDPRTRA